MRGIRSGCGSCANSAKPAVIRKLARKSVCFIATSFANRGRAAAVRDFITSRAPQGGGSIHFFQAAHRSSGPFRQPPAANPLRLRLNRLWRRAGKQLHVNHEMHRKLRNVVSLIYAQEYTSETSSSRYSTLQRGAPASMRLVLEPQRPGIVPNTDPIEAHRQQSIAGDEPPGAWRWRVAPVRKYPAWVRNPCAFNVIR
jgi:hypothetical protein